MQVSSLKLPLTIEEKQQLKACKVNIKEIEQMDLLHLIVCLNSSIERANYIRGLAQFQSIPSIGPKIAHRVVEMGYYSLEQIAHKVGSDLINEWEQKSGYREDPCLEDAFRCIVHHANHPRSSKSWFHFTSERKRYREQHGYPDTRPVNYS